MWLKYFWLNIYLQFFQIKFFFSYYFIQSELHLFPSCFALVSLRISSLSNSHLPGFRWAQFHIVLEYNIENMRFIRLLANQIAYIFRSNDKPSNTLIILFLFLSVLIVLKMFFVVTMCFSKILFMRQVFYSIIMILIKKNIGKNTKSNIKLFIQTTYINRCLIHII